MSISHLQHQVLSVVYIGKQYKPKSGGWDCRLVRVTAGARQCIRESKELKGTRNGGMFTSTLIVLPLNEQKLRS